MGPPDAATLTGQWLLSFSLLAINADGHDVMARFHAPGDEKRSVVIICAADRQAWLEAPPEQARQMLLLPDEIVAGWFGLPAEFTILDRVPILAAAVATLLVAGAAGRLLLRMAGADRGSTVHS